MRKNVKKLLSVAAFVFAVHSYGQEKVVTGQVLDADGFPVQDAYVYVEGKIDGVYTDQDGNYSIMAEKGDKVMIEYIGKETKTISITDKNEYVVRLTGQGAVALKEVVVMGYGSARDVASVASNVSVVSGDVVDKRPSANALDALQGQVSGLQIYTSTGEPSAASSIRLHGIGSIGGSNSPLFILDGVQVDSGIMNKLNPSDIENISVLKDAAATSIYGSRAANGVVYITTKRGKTGEGSLTVGVQQGFSTLADTSFFDGLFDAKGLAEFWVDTKYRTQAQVDELRKKYPHNTNWRKVYYKEYTPMLQVNTSFAGGADKARYYISGSYVDQEGPSYRSGLKRYNLRSNIDGKLNNWLSLGLNVSMAYSKYNQNGWRRSNSNGSLSWFAQPFYSPVDENGKEYVRIPGWNRYHPHYLADKNPSDHRQVQINTSGYVELNPFKNLTLRSQGGVQLYVKKHDYKRLPSYLESLNDGEAMTNVTNYVMKTITNTAEYKFKLGDRHNFIALAGQEYNDYNFEEVEGKGGGLNNDRLTLLGQTTKNKKVDQNRSEYAYSSFFGRLEYDFDKKYYLNASLRRDGSSRFGKENRFANFWSAGLMWKVKKEQFLDDVNWLSDLTVKLSTGTSGNSLMGLYDYQGNYESLALVKSSQYNGNPGYRLSEAGNPALSWEKQTLSTLTLDMEFYKRVGLELSFYNRVTKDLIFNVPTAFTTGFSSYNQNVGKLQNRGIDVTFNASVIKTKDYHIRPYVNFNYNQDKILGIFQDRKHWIIPNTGVGYVVGQSINYLYPIFKGINNQTGLAEWYLPYGGEKKVSHIRKDENAVTTTFSESTLEQNTGKKRYTPMTGGFGLSAGYKNFSLQSDFSFALGKNLINNDKFFAENPSIFTGYNQSSTVKDYWKKPGDMTRFPKYGEQFTRFDSRLIEDASFMRLKNITLAYDLPNSLTDRVKFLNGGRIYITGRNLWTLTKYSGLDPEVDSNIALGRNPNTKQYVFGFELKF